MQTAVQMFLAPRERARAGLEGDLNLAGGLALMLAAAGLLFPPALVGALVFARRAVKAKRALDLHDRAEAGS